MPYLPYEEPAITVILSLTSFLFLLNGVRYVLDHLLYCGIIGEILVGVVWGLPVGGTAWLSEGVQETIQAYGYLGLIGLVFEGGLATDLSLLKKTAYLSVSVATIGLAVPIALSFILLLLPFASSSGIAYPTPLAGFSAGASLCSTSLGTTFAILSSANMQRTRVGVLLVGAAMMDDVVGLVMVNIVTTLGNGGAGGWPIARPIAASFGLLLVTLTICPYVLKPVWGMLVNYLLPEVELNPNENPKSPFRAALGRTVLKTPHLSFSLSIAVIIIFVTIAYFTNASVLFAAFIAGGVVKFLWAVHLDQSGEDSEGGPSGMYNRYFKSVMDYVLVPFFFASIGFSIPITNMFSGSIVWKGIVYSILMIIGKGLVGIIIYFEHFMKWWSVKKPLQRNNKNRQSRPTSNSPQEASALQPLSEMPHAIALLVGFAMISRGEIGFLIASLSQSCGTLTLQQRGDERDTLSSGEDVFLVIAWAVVICTIVGPIGVGILVLRLRRANDGRSFPNWI